MIRPIAVLIQIDQARVVVVEGVVATGRERKPR
jgi:hypothetical protein